MKVKLIGNVAIVTSDITITQFENLQKFYPVGLKMKDKDGNDIFAIARTKAPSFTAAGACFNSSNAAGNLVLVVSDFKDKDDFAVKYGEAIYGLSAMEYSIANLNSTVSAKIEAIENAITIE